MKRVLKYFLGQKSKKTHRIHLPYSRPLSGAANKYFRFRFIMLNQRLLLLEKIFINCDYLNHYSSAVPGVRHLMFSVFYAVARWHGPTKIQNDFFKNLGLSIEKKKSCFYFGTPLRPLPYQKLKIGFYII